MKTEPTMDRQSTQRPLAASAGQSVDYEKYRRAAKRAEVATTIARYILWVVLLTGSIVFMLPLYMMIVMSLKSSHEIAASSVWAWPEKLTWENFQLVLSNPNAPFFLFFRNSAIIATLTTLGVIISSSLVAYPFARLRFRGRDRLFILLLSTMMLPGLVLMIPTFIMYKYLHWVDSWNPLWIPSWFGGGAFNIFLMRQFMMGIPRELDEAAFIDGAKHSTIFWRIVMPNSGAALATIGIFCFVYTWKDFMGPLIYLSSPEKQTLELGLNTYRALNQERWELLMAGSVLVMIPLIVMFLLGQRYFVKGIVMSGIK